MKSFTKINELLSKENVGIEISKYNLEEKVVNAFGERVKLLSIDRIVKKLFIKLNLIINGNNTFHEHTRGIFKLDINRLWVIMLIKALGNGLTYFDIKRHVW